jgi:hypothetical protein
VNGARTSDDSHGGQVDSILDRGDLRKRNGVSGISSSADLIGYSQHVQSGC